MPEVMPFVILAGSDQRPGPVPKELQVGDVLSGFKGAIPLPWGRSLAAELVARVRATGRFRDPLLVGPRAVYAGLVDCEIIDVGGTLTATLQRVIEVVRARFDGHAPMAVSACDILPTPSEITNLLTSEFDPHADCCFWWQWIAAETETLGASAWKPRYAIRRGPDAPPETVYPGHLVIFRPQTVRLELLMRLLTLAYRYRNWPPRQRVWPMLSRGLGLMLEEDLQNLGRGQLPILTVSIPWHLLRAYRELQTRRLTVPGLERHAARVLLHRRFRRRGRPVVISVSPILSFAQDIDTQAELDAICAQGAEGR